MIYSKLNYALQNDFKAMCNKSYVRMNWDTIIRLGIKVYRRGDNATSQSAHVIFSSDSSPGFHALLENRTWPLQRALLQNNNAAATPTQTCIIYPSKVLPTLDPVSTGSERMAAGARSTSSIFRPGDEAGAGAGCRDRRESSPENSRSRMQVLVRRNKYPLT